MSTLRRRKVDVRDIVNQSVDREGGVWWERKGEEQIKGEVGMRGEIKGEVGMRGEIKGEVGMRGEIKG